MRSLKDLNLNGQRLLLRVDFNVPLSEGRVADRTRIEETLPTVRLAMEAGARVICASHLGKPKGKVRPELSLAPVTVAFAEALGRPGRFVEDCVGPEGEKPVEKLAPGGSLLEEDKVPVAREILDLCRAEGKTIALPSDFVVAKSVDDAKGAATVGISKIPDDRMTVDVGQKTLEQFERLLAPAATIFWNGPMGVFEHPPFDRGTMALALLLPESDAVTVVGGGESVAAVNQAGGADPFTHVSTGGGASLEFITEGTLPGIEALESRVNS